MQVLFLNITENNKKVNWTFYITQLGNNDPIIVFHFISVNRVQNLFSQETTGRCFVISMCNQAARWWLCLAA